MGVITLDQNKCTLSIGHCLYTIIDTGLVFSTWLWVDWRWGADNLLMLSLVLEHRAWKQVKCSWAEIQPEIQDMIKGSLSQSVNVFLSFFGVLSFPFSLLEFLLFSLSRHPIHVTWGVKWGRLSFSPISRGVIGFLFYPSPPPLLTHTSPGQACQVVCIWG